MAIEFKTLKQQKTPTIKTNKTFEKKYGVKIDEPLTQSVLDVVKEKDRAIQNIAVKEIKKMNVKNVEDLQDPMKLISLLNDEQLLKIVETEFTFNEQLVGAINGMDLDALKEHFASVYENSDLGSELYSNCINDLVVVINDTLQEFQKMKVKGEGAGK